MMRAAPRGAALFVGSVGALAVGCRRLSCRRTGLAVAALRLGVAVGTRRSTVGRSTTRRALPTIDRAICAARRLLRGLAHGLPAMLGRRPASRHRAAVSGGVAPLRRWTAGRASGGIPGRATVGRWRARRIGRIGRIRRRGSVGAILRNGAGRSESEGQKRGEGNSLGGSHVNLRTEIGRADADLVRVTRALLEPSLDSIGAFTWQSAGLRTGSSRTVAPCRSRRAGQA